MQIQLNSSLAVLKRICVKLVAAWKRYVNTNLEKWRQGYKADSGIFEYCRSFIQQLIDAEGNLQILKHKKWGKTSKKRAVHTVKVIHSL